MKKQHRIVNWLLWFSASKWRKIIPNGIIVLAVIFGIATFFTLTNISMENGEFLLKKLIYIDVVLLSFIIFFVFYRIVKMIIPKRRESASGLQRRLATFFAILALTPAVIVATFSLMFFDLGLKTWFSKRVSKALNESRQVANAYLKEHRKNIVGDALGIARQLDVNFPTIAPNDVELEKALIVQGVLRNLTEAIVFKLEGPILARYGLTATLELEPLSKTAINRASKGDVVIFTKEKSQRVQALVKLNNFSDTYMIIGRFVDPKVIKHMQNTETAISEYVGLEHNRFNLQFSFSIAFILVVLLLLAVAVWMGLLTATTLTHPISLLIDATAKVGRGGYKVKLNTKEGYDELGQLMESFNKMTEDLDTSAKELKDAYKKLDNRSSFIETLLKGLSTGVIALSIDGKIQFMNISAKRLLNIKTSAFSTLKLDTYIPEFSRILSSVAQSKKTQQEQVSVQCAGIQRRLYIKVTVEKNNKKIVRYIVSFDDVSLLETAQKNAAWSDVARRIAHEIKNPLTPIQLSAERLKHRYLKNIPEKDAEIFSVCTNTIIRQVEQIERLVDEFNAFARMPKPSMIAGNIVETIKQSFALERAAHGQVKYSFIAPRYLQCVHDQHQIGQIVTNLLQNAFTALTKEGIKIPEIAVSIKREGQKVVLCVEDNGKGFPRDNRSQLLEPYISTQRQGTGLGLSIVKKIVEDHGGQIYLQDSKLGGACVKILLPCREDFEG